MHGTEGIEVEEAFLQALTRPRGLGLRAGAFYWEFGKHNAFHTHQYPFIERPVVWTESSASTGCSGAAVEASWLTPLPWFAELVVTALPLAETVYGDHEAPAAVGASGRACGSSGMWARVRRSTLDCRGPPATPRTRTTRRPRPAARRFIGVDVTWKWTGSGANPRSSNCKASGCAVGMIWTTARCSTTRPVRGPRARSRRLWTGGRFDAFLPDQPAEARRRDEASATKPLPNPDTGRLPRLRAERIPGLPHRLPLTATIGGDGDNGVRHRYNFTIGSHPAHRY